MKLQQYLGAWFKKKSRQVHFRPRSVFGHAPPLVARRSKYVRLLRVRQLAPVSVHQWLVASWTLAVRVKAWAMLCPVAPRPGPLLACEVMPQR
jgi:hypothetical protein